MHASHENRGRSAPGPMAGDDDPAPRGGPPPLQPLGELSLDDLPVPTQASADEELARLRLSRLSRQIDETLAEARAEQRRSSRPPPIRVVTAGDGARDEPMPAWQIWALVIACALGVEALAVLIGWLLSAGAG